MIKFAIELEARLTLMLQVKVGAPCYTVYLVTEMRIGTRIHGATIPAITVLRSIQRNQTVNTFDERVC